MITSERGAAPESILGYADLFDTPQQAVIGTDESGAIVYWSRTATAMYGWKEPEVLGRNILDVTPTNASRETADEIMSHLRRGRSWTGIFNVRHRDGSELTVEVRDLPVRDGAGRLVGIVGVSSIVGSRPD